MIQDTSRMSYRELLGSGVADTNEAKVLEAIRHFTELRDYPTDWDIVVYLNFKDRNVVAPRRNKLVEKGLVVQVGKKWVEKTGRMCNTWMALLTLDEPLFRMEGEFLVQNRPVPIGEFHGFAVAMGRRGYFHVGKGRWRRK